MSDFSGKQCLGKSVTLNLACSLGTLGRVLRGTCVTSGLLPIITEVVFILVNCQVLFELTEKLSLKGHGDAASPF